MKRVFTAWAEKEGEHPHTLIGGEGPPRFAEGTVQEDCKILVWRIEACTWEEAMSIYHLRQGWAPYDPGCEAAPCPTCGALLYPMGSGQCWNCDHECQTP